MEGRVFKTRSWSYQDLKTGNYCYFAKHSTFYKWKPRGPYEEAFKTDAPCPGRTTKVKIYYEPMTPTIKFVVYVVAYIFFLFQHIKSIWTCTILARAILMGNFIPKQPPNAAK